MGSFLISVVIPVYNAQAFLCRCVESVLAQTDSDWELVLINDGSKDGSAELCNALAARDSRIKAYHQPNAGAAAARNHGAELARGEYLAFVDADDYLSPDYLSYLRHLLTLGSARISCCGNVWTTNPSEAFECTAEETVQIMDARQAGMSVIGPLGLQMLVPWGKLIPRDLMLSYPFPNGRKAEDEAALYKILYKAGGVIIGSRVCYAYFQNSGSLMHNVDEKQRLDMLLTLRERVAFFKEQDEPDLADIMYGYYLNMMIGDWAAGHRDGLEDLKKVKVLSYLKCHVSVLYRANFLWWKLTGGNLIGFVDRIREKLHI